MPPACPGRHCTLTLQAVGALLRDGWWRPSEQHGSGELQHVTVASFLSSLEVNHFKKCRVTVPRPRLDPLSCAIMVHILAAQRVVCGAEA